MSNEVKVGIFVVASIIIFVYTFIAVANVQVRGERLPYKTYFSFAGGLEPGNVVRFAGLKAGVITGVRPGENDPTRIEVSLELRKEVPVNEQSVAAIASLSALGSNYLEVSPGSNDAARIEPGGVIPSKETASINDVTQRLVDVADTANKVMVDFNAEFKIVAEDARILLENLQVITGDDNQKSIQQLLANMNELVDDQSPKIDQITTQVSGLIVEVDKLVADFRQVADTADTAVNNVNRTVDETREPIKRDLAELEATLRRARLMLEDIQVLVTVNQSDIRQTVENFRQASENVEQMTDELRQRPWSLIRVKPKEDRQVPVAR